MPRLTEHDIGCVAFPSILYPPSESREEENKETGVTVEQYSRKRRAGKQIQKLTKHLIC